VKLPGSVRAASPDAAPPHANPSVFLSLILEELTEGRRTGQQKNLPRAAAGDYELGGEMAVSAGKTCILDGAVFLRLG
jgi:hypothetical protein